ncbi:MAG: hypothetical protein K6F50_07855 [Kiritimatiellae bacterium]|nr:hypothetical protein [Kiritimatiellia bacterium]
MEAPDKQKTLKFAVLLSSLGAAVAAGSLLGIVCRPSETEKPVEIEKIKVVTDNSALDNANRRIAELERELADLRSVQASPAAAEPAAEAVPAATVPAVQPLDLLSAGDGIEGQLKGSLSAAEYGVVSNVFAHMRARRSERAKGRMGFLESVDTSKMDDSDRSSHARYMELLARQEELAGKATGLIPDMGTLAEQVQLQMEIAPLAKKEREILLDQMTEELGYPGEEGEVIRDTIGDIVEATSSSGGISGMISTVIDDIGTENISTTPQENP